MGIPSYNDITGNFLISRRASSAYIGNFDQAFQVAAPVISTADRYAGAMLGLAIGDALGAPVEFMRRGTFPRVTDFQNGGPHDLKAGQWTDDTIMALCMAESLLVHSGIDVEHQMALYGQWYNDGYNSPTGECFDIGSITATAIRRYLDGEPAPWGGDHEMDSGNGGIMRMIPSVLAFSNKSFESRMAYARFCSAVTHGSAEALDAVQLMADIARLLLCGLSIQEAMGNLTYEPVTPAVQALLTFDYSTTDRDLIPSGGYCVDTLRAAIWCLWNTITFRDAVQRAVNLGDDTDTTGAVTGQLAGLIYGVQGIPAYWVSGVHRSEYIQDIAQRLHDVSHDVEPFSTQAIQ